MALFIFFVPRIKEFHLESGASRDSVNQSFCSAVFRLKGLGHGLNLELK